MLGKTWWQFHILRQKKNVVSVFFFFFFLGVVWWGCGGLCILLSKMPLDRFSGIIIGLVVRGIPVISIIVGNE